MGVSVVHRAKGGRGPAVIFTLAYGYACAFVVNSPFSKANIIPIIRINLTAMITTTKLSGIFGMWYCRFSTTFTFTIREETYIRVCVVKPQCATGNEQDSSKISIQFFHGMSPPERSNIIYCTFFCKKSQY